MTAHLIHPKFTLNVHHELSDAVGTQPTKRQDIPLSAIHPVTCVAHLEQALAGDREAKLRYIPVSWQSNVCLS